MKVNKDKYGQMRITISQSLCKILDVDGGEDMNFVYRRECPYYTEKEINTRDGTTVLGVCGVRGLIKLFEVVVEK